MFSNIVCFLNIGVACYASMWCSGYVGSYHFVLSVVVVCPLQPSSYVNPGCPCPESSVPVLSRLACPISSQVTDHWG